MLNIVTVVLVVTELEPNALRLQYLRLVPLFASNVPALVFFFTKAGPSCLLKGNNGLSITTQPRLVFWS